MKTLINRPPLGRLGVEVLRKKRMYFLETMQIFYQSGLKGYIFDNGT